MFSTILKLLRNEDGATAIEYGLIAALIAVAAVTVMGTVGTNLSTTSAPSPASSKHPTTGSNQTPGGTQVPPGVVVCGTARAVPPRKTTAMKKTPDRSGLFFWRMGGSRPPLVSVRDIGRLDRGIKQRDHRRRNVAAGADLKNSPGDAQLCIFEPILGWNGEM